MSKKTNKLQIICDAVCGVLMLTSILVFLLVGIFVPDSWHPVWVILPSSGLLCGIVSIIVNAIVNCQIVKNVEEKKEENTEE